MSKIGAVIRNPVFEPPKLLDFGSWAGIAREFSFNDDFLTGRGSR